jgi:hypothetical protein
LGVRPCRQRRLEAPERQHPPPCPCLAARPLDEFRVGAREALRRPKHEAHITEVERAPTPPRRKRHLRECRRVLDLHKPCARDRLQREVAGGGTGGIARQRMRELSLVHAAGGYDSDHAQRRLGQRADLVGADNVDRGKRLDRVQLLREHASLRDFER